MIVRIAMSRRIAARPEPIRAVIADYHDGHRRIVPPRVFKWLAVDKGGVGGGTEIRFAMRVLGSTRVTRGIGSTLALRLQLKGRAESAESSLASQ